VRCWNPFSGRTALISSPSLPSSCEECSVDSQGQTVDFYLSETRDREAAKCFLKKALTNPDNHPPPPCCPLECVVELPCPNGRVDFYSVVARMIRHITKDGTHRTLTLGECFEANVRLPGSPLGTLRLGEFSPLALK